MFDDIENKDLGGHIEDVRIMELALNDASTMQSGESSHLEGCALCTSRLNEERALTESIHALSPSHIPEGFSAATIHKFDRTTSSRTKKSLLIGALVFLTTIATSAALVAMNAAEELTNLVRSLGAISTLASSVSSIVRSDPMLALTAVFTVCGTALFLLIVLSRMARSSDASAPVSKILKYSEPPSVPQSGNGNS